MAPNETDRSDNAMSSSPTPNAPGAGKKAVHVKWAGKTIALGTFPSAEADEKCQKAKALTRAWRSTMRPKPSREWVMVELERLGVRVVSGRLGRKAGEEGDEPPPAQDKPKPLPGSNDTHSGGNIMAQPGMERSSSLGWGSEADLQTLMARRNSSLGLSMMGETLARRGSLSSLGQVMGLEGDPTIPPHRPFVGGGAAAAYEAARHDHFQQKSAEQQRRASSLGLGSLAGGGLGMSVNPNQHYEMLKLHHMNLLNEIQETTLMMNLYQQQQLQQQQQQLQQQASAEQLGANAGSADTQLSMLMQQQNGVGTQAIDGMFANSQMGQHRASLGLGAASQISGFAGSGALASTVRNGHAGTLSGGLPGQLQSSVQSAVLGQGNSGSRENGGGDDASSQPVPPAVGSDGGTQSSPAASGSGNKTGANSTEGKEKKRGKASGEEASERKYPKRTKNEDSPKATDNSASKYS